MANILTGTVTLKVEDGSTMNAYSAMPDDNEKHPGIMVFQEAFGVNNHIKNVAKRIAAEGYIVIAPELFHRSAAAGAEFPYTDFETIRPHFSAITVEGLGADVKAAFEWLKQNPKLKNNKIGTIGFCLGGRVSLLANITLPVSASISYYGGGSQTLIDKFGSIHAPQLFFWGGLDKHIIHEHVDSVIKAMKDAGKQFINVEISYADHAFNSDERPNYNAKASKEAWAMSMAFFANNLV
jgi:carboxymethylenebutenolidase